MNLLGLDSFEGMPSTAVILAELDPLRSEGEALAKAMEEDGVSVESQVFTGVTHEFFGMGKVVGAAKETNDMAIKRLNAAFTAPSSKEFAMKCSAFALAQEAPFRSP